MRHYRLVTAALAAGLALSACGKGGGPQGPPPLSVDAAAATRGDIATFINLDGQVAPLLQSTLAFQQQGPITAVYVNVGDRVSAGQVLARIDASTLQAQLAQAEAATSQASATARGATVGLPVQVQTNNATLASARAALDNAKLVYDQNVQLVQARLRLADGAAELSGSVRRGPTGLQQRAGRLAEQHRERGERQGADGGRAVVGRAGQRPSHADRADDALRAVRRSRHAAPDGSRRDGHAEHAGPFDLAGRHGVDQHQRSRHLPCVRASRFARHADVSSLPGKTFQARIQNVNAVPTSGTLSYLARVAMPNPGDVLRGGMLISATIPKEQRSGVIIVPRSAIAEDQSGSSVFIVQDGKAVQVPVRVGLETDTQAEVASDKITAGTKVITTRPDALKDGSVVAVNGAPGAPGAAGGGAAH